MILQYVDGATRPIETAGPMELRWQGQNVKSVNLNAALDELARLTGLEPASWRRAKARAGAFK